VLLSLSVPLVKGDRVGTRLIVLRQCWRHVVQVCREGCHVGENVMESSLEPCLVEFFGECCGWVCKYDGHLLVQNERVPCGLVANFE